MEKKQVYETGDIVRVFDGAFGDAVITKVNGNEITLIRPYMTTADFECSNSRIAYMGWEEFTTSVASAELKILQRKDHHFTDRKGTAIAKGRTLLKAPPNTIDYDETREPVFYRRQWIPGKGDVFMVKYGSDWYETIESDFVLTSNEEAERQAIQQAKEGLDRRDQRNLDAYWPNGQPKR